LFFSFHNDNFWGKIPKALIYKGKVFRFLLSIQKYQKNFLSPFSFLCIASTSLSSSSLISMFFTIFYPSLGKSLVNIIKLNLDNKKGSLYNKNKLLKRF